MLPTVDIGPWHASTYSQIYCLAVLITLPYSFHRLLRLGLAAQVIGRCILAAVLAGLVGAFLWPQLAWALQLFAPHAVPAQWGSNSILAAIVVGGIVIVWCARRCRVPVGRAFDVGALPFPLAQAVGRLGCLAAGCCYGRPTGSWLGVYLPDAAGRWQVRYPTQLLSAGIDLFLFVLALCIERCGQARSGRRLGEQGWPFDGFLTLLYFILFPLKRCGMEFLRGDVLAAAVGLLNGTQLLCLAIALTATGLMVLNLTRASRSAVTVDPQTEETQAYPGTASAV